MPEDLNLDWLNADEPQKKSRDKSSKKPRAENKIPGPNQLKKLKQENKTLKERYEKLKHHELTEENIIKYFTEIKKAKLYELDRFFSMNRAHEIRKVLKSLLNQKIIFRGKNGWHRINPNYKNIKNKQEEVE